MRENKNMNLNYGYFFYSASDPVKLCMVGKEIEQLKV